MVNSYTLKIFVEDPELKDVYFNHIEGHKKRISEQGRYGDSGFDLLVPRFYSLETEQNPIRINMEVRCALFRTNSVEVDEPCGFYLYPRSSLYKFNLRLTNSVGIIDAGYRGPLAGVFDVVVNIPCGRTESDNSTPISKYSRLVQICSPDLRPIVDIRLVDTLDELEETTRGEGGFGSTGK